MSKGRVALMTIYQVPNYGSVLQAFATVKIIEAMEYECELINYSYPNEWHFKRGSKRYHKSLLQNIYVYLSTILHLKRKHIFNRRLKKFIRRHLPQTKPMSTLEELAKFDWSNYEAVLVGSDQVWNPNFLHGDSAFMLSFVSDSVKKISISSSFTVGNIPKSLVDKYKKFLNRFDFISVRELSGLDIIQKQLDLRIPSYTFLDPTLLLSREEWNEKLELNKTIPDRYLLLYLLDYAFNPVPYIFEVAKYFHKRDGLEIKVIYENEPLVKRNLKEYTFCTGASPKSFIELVKNADLVITSSFHGTAFAIIFGCPLISIVPECNDSRQLSLLKQLEIPECGVKINTPFVDIKPRYDVSKVHSLLDHLRSENILIIQNQFSN